MEWWGMADTIDVVSENIFTSHRANCFSNMRMIRITKSTLSGVENFLAAMDVIARRHFLDSCGLIVHCVCDGRNQRWDIG